MRGKKGKIGQLQYESTDCLNETNAVNNKLIQRETKFPVYDSNELVFSGPHFYVSNPFNKTPRSKCLEKADYDTIDLSEINQDFLPRTNYTPNIESKFNEYFKKL